MVVCYGVFYGGVVFVGDGYWGVYGQVYGVRVYVQGICWQNFSGVDNGDWQNWKVQVLGYVEGVFFEWVQFVVVVVGVFWEKQDVGVVGEVLFGLFQVGQGGGVVVVVDEYMVEYGVVYVDYWYVL